MPKALARMQELSRSFAGKPQFVIKIDGHCVSGIREDYLERINPLIRRDPSDFPRRLSTSEWRFDIVYHGNEDYLGGVPLTLHDVFEQDGITVKTGNPYSNNSWIEFFRALQARHCGLVEAKSPVGFVYWTDDLYGENRPGRMFYKHLDGVDIEKALSMSDQQTLNWALWETGKFFSRLINARLYLEDSDRLGNLFIENGPRAKVFRFLDLEAMTYQPAYSNAKKTEMLAKFIKSAVDKGFLSPERLGEFMLVCVGANIKLLPMLFKTLGYNN